MSSTVRFADVQRKLNAAGWFVDRVAGSHHVIKKPGVPTNLAIPVHNGKCKLAYDRQADKAIRESQGQRP